MKINYDKDVDALYIQFNKNKVHKTAEKDGNVLVDYDKNGRVTGLEILDYSDTAPRSNGFRVSVGRKEMSINSK